MLVKTRAILLKTVKFSENSVIARFYTEAYGLESFIINNIRAKKGAVNAAQLQPLSLLEADIYQRGNANLQRIKELRANPLLHNIYTQMPKTSAIMFMQEVLGKVIVEKEQNQTLFSFLFNQICWLEDVAKLPGIFPSYWLLQLSKHLGFFPEIESWAPGSIFMPHQGIFAAQVTEPVYFDAPNAQAIHQLCAATLQNFDQVHLTGIQKRELLENVLLYYRLHIEGFNELKSHKVLAEVLG